MEDKRFYVDDEPLPKNIEKWLRTKGGHPPKEPPQWGPFDTAPIIKHMRESRGLTQNQLAKLLGKDRTCVAALERGHSSARFSTMAQIARVLGYEIVIRKKETK